ncbi:MAG: helix-turn-helix domain-containing protein [Oscillospiraceae bacterium]|nr:helix-turn-helix domain-containing protein [Oscillospiraceae bacterium]
MLDKKSIVKNENFIVIHGWMVNELNLKGNELLVYAIIYAFSQTENQFFTGSLKYLADWTSSTKQGVMKNLKSLLENNLIQKEEYYVNNVKFVKYYTTKFNTPMQQSLTGYTTKFNGGIKLSLPNNIIDNIADKITNKIDSETDGASPETENSKQKEKISYDEILELYNSICKSLPKAHRLTENRRNAIRTRLHDGYSVDDIKKAFELAQTSPFLRGEVNKAFHADFDWILSDDHMLKILKNKYKDRSVQNSSDTYRPDTKAYSEEFLRSMGVIP